MLYVSLHFSQSKTLRLPYVNTDVEIVLFNTMQLNMIS